MKKKMFEKVIEYDEWIPSEVNDMYSVSTFLLILFGITGFVSRNQLNYATLMKWLSLILGLLGLLIFIGCKYGNRKVYWREIK